MASTQTEQGEAPAHALQPAEEPPERPGCLARLFGRPVAKRVAAGALQARQRASRAWQHTSARLAEASRAVSERASGWLSSVSQSEVGRMLKGWTDGIANAPDHLYDRALVHAPDVAITDGEDLEREWARLRQAPDTEPARRELVGYFAGIWADLTTPQGLPFDRWDAEMAEAWREWASHAVPVNPSLFYDLMKFEERELFCAGLGAISSIFVLGEDDRVRLAELLGALGAVPALGANPIMGLCLMVTVAYAYFVKKHRLDSHGATAGAWSSRATMGVYVVLGALGLPFLWRLYLGMVTAHLVRRHLLSDDVLKMVGDTVAAAGPAVRGWWEQVRGGALPLLAEGRAAPQVAAEDAPAPPEVLKPAGDRSPPPPADPGETT